MDSDTLLSISCLVVFLVGLVLCLTPLFNKMCLFLSTTVCQRGEIHRRQGQCLKPKQKKTVKEIHLS